MVEKYRLVAKGMRRTVVYLESVLDLVKVDVFCFFFLEGFGFFFSLTPKKSAF